MAEILIFDTSVLVDHLRTGRHQVRIDAVAGLVRMSSVVLAELWRGASERQERELLKALARNQPLLTPTEKNWVDSGQILGRIRADLGLEATKLRDLHFDVLIALTARSYGARLITSNPGDFELVRKYREFRHEIW